MNNSRILRSVKKQLSRDYNMVSPDRWAHLLEGCLCKEHRTKCLLSFRKNPYHHDRTCCFDITTLLEGRHILQGLEILWIFWLMREALLTETFHLGGYEATEGFAGSAPLALLEIIAYKSPDKTKVWGRWNSLIDSKGPPYLHWAPTDGDYFITGNDQYFFARVNTIIAKLRMQASKINNILEVNRPVKNLYAFRNTPIWIVNVTLSGFSTPISFVQSPTATNMLDVLNSFDIDIARTFYDCASTGYIIVKSNTFERIRAGKAEVDDLVVPVGGPTAFDIKKIGSTFKRMHKYGVEERGYTFLNYPEFLLDVGTQTTSMETDDSTNESETRGQETRGLITQNLD